MTLADLAGKVERLRLGGGHGRQHHRPDLVTIDAAGAATISCSTNGPATPEADCILRRHPHAQSSFVANADGGFDLSFTAGG